MLELKMYFFAFEIETYHLRLVNSVVCLFVVDKIAGLRVNLPSRKDRHIVELLDAIWVVKHDVTLMRKNKKLRVLHLFPVLSTTANDYYYHQNKQS